MIMDFVIMDGEVARKGEPPQTTKKQQFTPSTTQTKVRKILDAIKAARVAPFFMSRKRSMPMLFNAATAGCSGETRDKILELWD
jgi:hypothetical protein